MSALHGWQYEAPDRDGRARFVLYWRHGNKPRGQHFHAVPAAYADVTWHATDVGAQAHGWGFAGCPEWARRARIAGRYLARAHGRASRTGTRHARAEHRRFRADALRLHT